MMGMRWKNLLCFAAAALASYAFGAEITSVRFSGLKWTRQSYMQKVLAQFVGADSDALDLGEVETVLRSEGLFSEIAVSFSEDGATIHVAVTEKWSFIPLPFCSYTNDGFMGGLILMDNNAFGQKNTLMVGGVFSSSYLTAMLRLQRPAIYQKQIGYSSFLSYNKKNVKLDDLDEHTFAEIKSHKLNAEFALEKKLSPFFTVSLGTKYAGFVIPDGGSISSVHQWTANPAIKYAELDWNGWFLSEKYVEAKAEAGGSTEKTFVMGMLLHGFFQQPIVPRVRLCLDASLSLESHKNILLQQTRQNVSNTLIPSNFHSPAMAAADCTVEAAILKAKILILSFYAGYQAIAADDCDGGIDFSHGPGGGLKLYLQKINFPACSLGLYYNVPHAYIQFGASIGVSF